MQTAATAARMESLPMGDILDFLKAGDGGDVLDLDELGFVWDEAIETELAGAGASGTVTTGPAPLAMGATPATAATEARLSIVNGPSTYDLLGSGNTPLLPLAMTPSGAVGGGGPSIAMGGGVLQQQLPGLKVEEQHAATSSIEETTPLAAMGGINSMPLQGMQGFSGVGFAAAPLQGAGASSFGNNHSHGSAHSGAAAAAAAAAAVAAMQAAQAPLYEDGAQSAQRVNNRSNASLNKTSAAQPTFTEETGDAPPTKKKRTRNAEQMEQNRQAQQKYRERKKAEHEQLNRALEQLTAQLAAMKALEAQTMLLRNQNQALSTTVDEQAARINQLTVQVEAQAAELVEARRQAAESSGLASTQQRMILDQHQKLQLQEEVIAALKGRLQDKMDEAFAGHDKKTVCQRMVAAVRSAIEGASNVEGLQESLAQLPDSVVTDICRSILHEVKGMWPELAARFQAAGLACAPPHGCSAEVGAY